MSSSTLNIALMSTACGLTITGATITLFLIHWLKVKTRFSSYIRILLLSDILFSIMTIVARTISTGPQSYGICSTLQFFVVFSSIMSFYWTLSFAFNTYTIVNRETQDIEQYFLKHLAASVVISLLFAGVPAIFNAYGVSRHGGCGVNGELTNGNAVTFIIQYIPLLICFFLILCFYGLVLIRLYQCAKEENVDVMHLKSVLYQFVPYPLILFICGTPGTVALIITMTTGKDIQPLLLAGAFMYRSIGFLNSVVYGLHNEMKKKLKEKFSKQRIVEYEYSIEELDRQLSVESMKYDPTFN